MTRPILIAVGLSLLTSVGCLHLQPVGPIMNPTGDAKAIDLVGKSRPTESKEVVRAPMIQPTPPPAPPALFVTPGEITDGNAQDKIRRLMDEMEADRKAMETWQRPSEVSVIKR